MRDYAEDFDDDFDMGVCMWRKQIWEYREMNRLNSEYNSESINRYKASMYQCSESDTDDHVVQTDPRPHELETAADDYLTFFNVDKTPDVINNGYVSRYYTFVLDNFETCTYEVRFDESGLQLGVYYAGEKYEDYQLYEHRNGDDIIRFRDADYVEEGWLMASTCWLPIHLV